jgi:hypothetical protein
MLLLQQVVSQILNFNFIFLQKCDDKFIIGVPKSEFVMSQDAIDLKRDKNRLAFTITNNADSIE